MTVAQPRVRERLLARGYGLVYGPLVARLRAHTALLDEVAAAVARSVDAAVDRRAQRILDVSCGVGTVAIRLGRDGYSVVGVDSVAPLVRVARRSAAAQGLPNVRFHALDVARDDIPDGGRFDVVVSMHTLYWHAEPDAVLAACRRALRPHGHAVVLAYAHRTPPSAALRRLRHEGVREAAAAALWLVATALFERLHRFHARYLDEAALRATLARAGFDVLDCQRTFLNRMTLLAWTRVSAGATQPDGVPRCVVNA